MTQGRLHLTAPADRRPAVRLDQLPSQLPDPCVAIDVETDGLGPTSLPVGVSLATSTDEWYFPFGHTGGGAQHEEGLIRLWLANHLEGKDVIFKEAKRDLRWLKRWGLDLELLGVRPHDVQHQAALLDDHRRVFTLEALAQDRLGRGKVPLDARYFHELPADQAAVYARQDARLTHDLAASYDQDIAAEDLTRVLALEDQLIYCVMSMEDAGAPLDVKKLARWDAEILEAYLARVLELCRRVNFRVNPNSGLDLKKLFKHLGLAVPSKYDPEKHEVRDSFEEDLLLPLAGHWEGTGKTRQFKWDSRDLQLVVEAKQLDSLRSKCTTKFLKAVDGRGVLPYQLHQLRADEGGTIMGRFASSKVNIQQVMKPDKQPPVTHPWIIRQLFVPARGRFLHADASQIEFRMLAHYVSTVLKQDRLAKAYRDNPQIDFHQLVTDKILRNLMPRVLVKNFNFMKVYGGGVGKVVTMTGLGEAEAEDRNREYDREFPEAKQLMRTVSRVAEERGYVRTFTGRRRRFREGEKFYSALHAVLSGTAADVMKLKLLRVYDERKTLDLLLRHTEHDELNGDAGSGKTLKLTRECLAVQELPLRVPITWEAGVGKNWKEAS